jgi:hypothetical protein
VSRWGSLSAFANISEKRTVRGLVVAICDNFSWQQNDLRQHVTDDCQEVNRLTGVLSHGDGSSCDWLRITGVKVLNVAGPRQSKCPGIYDKARTFLLGSRRLPEAEKARTGVLLLSACAMTSGCLVVEARPAQTHNSSLEIICVKP